MCTYICIHLHTSAYICIHLPASACLLLSLPLSQVKLLHLATETVVARVHRAETVGGLQAALASLRIVAAVEGKVAVVAKTNSKAAAAVPMAEPRTCNPSSRSRTAS